MLDMAVLELLAGALGVVGDPKAAKLALDGLITERQRIEQATEASRKLAERIGSLQTREAALSQRKSAVAKRERAVEARERAVAETERATSERRDAVEQIIGEMGQQAPGQHDRARCRR